jgi:acetyl-CoA synthetase
LYTAPTAVRALMAFSQDLVKKHDRSSLKIIGTVGEPINPSAWKWLYHVVGEGKCAVVDTYWQTETGGHVIVPLPGATPTKPGAATLPFLGVEPVLVDHRGALLEGPGEGSLVSIKRKFKNFNLKSDFYYGGFVQNWSKFENLKTSTAILLSSTTH